MSAIRTPSPPPKRSQNVTVRGATGAPVIPAPRVLQPPSARAPAPTAEARRKERRESDAGGWMSFSFRNLVTGSPSCSTRGSAPPCSARRTGVRLGGQVRPALAIPADRADAEPEVSGPDGVVVVVREVVAVHRQVQDPRRAGGGGGHRRARGDSEGHGGRRKGPSPRRGDQGRCGGGERRGQHAPLHGHPLSRRTGFSVDGQTRS